jgi:bifunctional DNA-binding transcriptional regulator/antitoxin component of YhaV-PrlF toxin-antitoxin module
LTRLGGWCFPKKFREELALNPGDMLRISVHGNGLTLKRKTEVAGFARRNKALIFSTASEDVLEREEVGEIIEGLRNEKAMEIAGRLVSHGKPRRKTRQS